MGKLDSQMPRILCTLIFKHPRGKAFLFSSHVHNVESPAALDLCLQFSSSSGPGSSGYFQKRNSDRGI